MGLPAADRDLLARAFAFAVEAHGAGVRRRGGAPVISHPLQVAGLVLEFGGDAEQAAAALLHDLVEDVEGVDPGDIEKGFGSRVASIVAADTDMLPGDTPRHRSDWTVRKRLFVDRLGELDADAALVVACDKLHNLTAIVDGLRAEGKSSLAVFNAEPADLVWFYEAVHDRLSSRLPPPLRERYGALLQAAHDEIDC